MNLKSFGFIPWLIFFFIALVSIPFFIWFDFLGIAKLIGIAVTVSLVMVLRIWLYRLGKLGKPSRVSLNANDVYELNRFMPILASLPIAEQRAFHHRIGLIMSKVTVNQMDTFTEAQISPKSLAMLGASIFILNGLESKESLTFVLSANDKLEFRDNELTTSFEAAKKALLSSTAEEIRSVLGA